jgi:hypothetical protein
VQCGSSNLQCCNLSSNQVCHFCLIKLNIWKAMSIEGLLTLGFIALLYSLKKFYSSTVSSVDKSIKLELVNWWLELRHKVCDSNSLVKNWQRFHFVGWLEGTLKT